MTSLLSWRRSILSISALLLFAYLVSCAPFLSPNQPAQEMQQQQQQQQQQQRKTSPFPKGPSKMSIHPSTDLSLSISLKQLTLSKASTTPQPLPLHITIENTADHPITVLKWNSPLDPKAGLLGVFHLTSSSTGEELTLDTLKFNRKLPPSEEDMVEIPAGEKVEADVEVPRVKVGGESDGFKVRAEGKWHGMWRGGVEEVMREKMAEGREGLGDAGTFKSNEVEVTVA
ncbi:hypothetical protein FQN54_001096 [Arachnomyces sp. PD_36]|nr:hypothetical protein FQN54_001096 [Arachnomyces sp. PD_36]